jgi:prepilin-type N-terminal cleavage/methylation domain-containing protein
LLTFRRSENGFTIVEASVAMVIVGILLAAVYSLVIRVNQDAANQVALADSERTLREAASALDRELRQANPDTDKGNAVQELDWDEIRFLSYVNPSSDLQLHRYFLVGDCTIGCTLKKAVYAPIPASDPPAYNPAATFTMDLATGLLASPTAPAFVGQVWAGGATTDILSCDEAGPTKCDFALVRIALKTSTGRVGVPDVQIVEQVRIRNAQ